MVYFGNSLLFSCGALHADLFWTSLDRVGAHFISCGTFDGPFLTSGAALELIVDHVGPFGGHVRPDRTIWRRLVAQRATWDHSESPPWKPKVTGGIVFYRFSALSGLLIRSIEREEGRVWQLSCTMFTVLGFQTQGRTRHRVRVVLGPKGWKEGKRYDSFRLPHALWWVLKLT
jgi:hypothetical protein